MVGTLLALFLLGQHLTAIGVLGLTMVVGGVAGGYLEEVKETSGAPVPG